MVFMNVSQYCPQNLREQIEKQTCLMIGRLLCFFLPMKMIVINGKLERLAGFFGKVEHPRFQPGTTLILVMISLTVFADLRYGGI